MSAVEPPVPVDGNVVFGDEILKHLLGGVWLEDPHRALGAVDSRGALTAVAIVRPLLPFPGVVTLIVLPDAMVELPSQTPDDFLTARVGPAEPARREAAEMRIGTNENDRLAHPDRLHGCHDTG